MDKTDIAKVKAGLLDLTRDRESFFRGDGDDEIYRYDYQILHKAIEMLNVLYAEITNRDLWKTHAEALEQLYLVVFGYGRVQL